jgi:hypothetical protein
MRWIVGSSLRFRWLVIFAAAAIMIFGVVGSRNASVDVYPEFAPPHVAIQTIAIGNSSQEVEELITIPLEEQLNGLEGLDDMRSRSVADLSSIELIGDTHVAYLGEPAFYVASTVGAEPGHGDRAFVERAEPDPDVHDLLLEDQAALAASVRRRGREHLG